MVYWGVVGPVFSSRLLSSGSKVTALVRKRGKIVFQLKPRRGMLRTECSKVSEVNGFFLHGNGPSKKMASFSEADSVKNKVLLLQRQVMKARLHCNANKIFPCTCAPLLLWPVFAVRELFLKKRPLSDWMSTLRIFMLSLMDNVLACQAGGLGSNLVTTI